MPRPQDSFPDHKYKTRVRDACHVSVLKTETDTDYGRGHDVNKDAIDANDIKC